MIIHPFLAQTCKLREDSLGKEFSPLVILDDDVSFDSFGDIKQNRANKEQMLKLSVDELQYRKDTASRSQKITQSTKVWALANYL